MRALAGLPDQLQGSWMSDQGDGLAAFALVVCMAVAGCTRSGGADADGSGGVQAIPSPKAGCCLTVVRSCTNPEAGYYPTARVANGMCLVSGDDVSDPECASAQCYAGTDDPRTRFGTMPAKLLPGSPWDPLPEQGFATRWRLYPGLDGWFSTVVASPEEEWVYVIRSSQAEDESTGASSSIPSQELIRVAADGSSACAVSLEPKGVQVFVVAPSGTLYYLTAALSQRSGWFLACGDTRVTAWSPELVRLWELDVPGPIMGEPAVDSQGNLAFKAGRHLASVSPSGALRWRTAIDEDWLADNCDDYEGMLPDTSRDPTSTAVVIDRQDHLYVIGRGGEAGGAYTLELHRVAPGGRVDWSVPVEGTSVYLLHSGDAVVTGGDHLNVLDPEGRARAQATNQSPQAHAVNAALVDGRFVVSAPSLLILYDGLAEKLWHLGAKLKPNEEPPPDNPGYGMAPSDVAGGFLTEQGVMVVPGVGRNYIHYDKLRIFDAFAAVDLDSASLVDSHLPFIGFDIGKAALLRSGLLVAPSFEQGGPAYALDQPYGGLKRGVWSAKRADPQRSGRQPPLP